MREKILSVVVVGSATALSAAVALGALVWWLRRPPTARVIERTPTLAETPGRAALGPVTSMEGGFRQYGGAPGPSEGFWPRFRGPDSDNVGREDVPLSGDWGGRGPPVVWSVDLGEGHAGAAVLGGRVYVLDYDERSFSDALRCFSLQDGKEIWRRWYDVRIKRNHGMSRTVPAVTEKYVVTIGPKCHVMCCDAKTGAFRWGIDLVRGFETTVPLWYTGQCPLIHNDLAVIAPGGKVLMMAVACETGEVVWRTPNPHGWRMSHSSVMEMTLGDRKVFVYAAIGGVAGVAAEGPDAGSLLWETTEWDHAVVAPSPVMMGGGRIFLTAGYGAGSAMLRVSAKEEGFAVERPFVLDREVFACEQQTPVFYGGHLFAVLPKDAGQYRQQLVCLRPDGEVVWRSGKAERFGLGPFMVADGKILVLDDSGFLTVARATAAGYEKLGRAKVVDGRDPWGPMALASGKLLLRDSRRLVCLDLRAEREEVLSE